MALTFPYPLDFLSDILPAISITPDFQRNDEGSGSGDGRFWTAELARPLWKFTVSLGMVSPRVAREINAKIRALGHNKAFLFADPSYSPSGGAPGTGVTLGSVSSDRTQVSFAGLPAGFALAPGDRFSISYASGRVFLGEISEPKTATGLGNTSLGAIMPYLPFGIAAGAAVEMIKPVVKVIVPPGKFTPYPADPAQSFATGASLTLLQKP